MAVLAGIQLSAGVATGSRPTRETSALVGLGAGPLAAAELADRRAAVGRLPFVGGAVAGIGTDACAAAKTGVAVEDIVAGDLRAVFAVPARIAAATVGAVAAAAIAAVVAERACKEWFDKE